VKSTKIHLFVIAFVGFVAAATLFASSGVLVQSVGSPFQVSVAGRTAWEPTSAVGTTWATGWRDWTSGQVLVSTWSGGWRTPVAIATSASDLYLAWDGVHQRFVYVYLSGAGSIYFGYSINGDPLYCDPSQKTCWSTPVQLFSGTTWDYPSVGVDNSGRVIVGAVGAGFWTRVSATDGVTFGSAVQVVTGTTGFKTRVVATNNLFEVIHPPSL